MSSLQEKRLLDLPSEVLLQVFANLTTPAFILTTRTCRKLFLLASESREIILQHLHRVPGIKLGVEDRSISTLNLFLILRQRASDNLFGVNFTADCREYRLPNGTLAPSASCLTASADYVNISLSLKQSLTVRLFGGGCFAREQILSPYADGCAEILFVDHKKHSLSVLYRWTPENRGPEPHLCSRDVPFGPSSRQLVAASASDRGDLTNRSRLISPDEEILADPKTRYHLFHYSTHSSDRPTFFPIPAHKKDKSLVPVHLTVHNRLSCAIIWDKPDARFRPSTSTEVVFYKSKHLPTYEEGSYTSQVVYPQMNSSRSRSSEHEERSKRLRSQKPRAAAFFKDGRRLKLYSPGSVVPYAIVLSTGEPREYPLRNQSLENQTTVSGKHFRIDTAFFGNHEPIFIDGRAECVLTHLCLGTTNMVDSMGPAVLCILQCRKKVEYEDCRHCVDLDCMPHISQQSHVVARLWGWKECSSSITGFDNVCISRRGTRIAIAMWDRILVWTLNPIILCEQWENDEDDSDEGVGMANLSATKFYDLVEEVELGGAIVELRPVVLKLGGAVARKMMWSSRNAVDETVDVPEDSGESDDSFTSTEAEDQPDRVNSASPPSDAEDLDREDGEQHGQAQEVRQDESWIEADDEKVPTATAAPVRNALEQRIEHMAAQALASTATSSTLSHRDIDRELPAASMPVIPPFAPELPSTGTASSWSAATASASASASATGSKHKNKTKEKRDKKPRPRRVRKSEDELIVMTDHGVQMWDLSPRGRGRRTKLWFDERLS